MGMYAVFERFCTAINTVEEEMKQDGYEYMYSTHLGYILTCPSNLGTGIRAGCHIKIPKLSEHAEFANILKKMRLQKRAPEVVMDGSISPTRTELDFLSWSLCRGYVTELTPSSRWRRLWKLGTRLTTWSRRPKRLGFWSN